MQNGRMANSALNRPGRNVKCQTSHVKRQNYLSNHQMTQRPTDKSIGVQNCLRLRCRVEGMGLVERGVHSPPFSRRGGCAINKKIPFLSGADGVVGNFKQK